MKIIIAGILFLILFFGGFMLYNYYVKRKSKKLAALKLKVVEPLVRKLALREDINQEEIVAIVKNPSFCYIVFWILQANHRTDLFPAEYFTQEKGAESFLVNWLEFPTELGAPPEEVELLTKVTVESDQSLDYYVFKFRVVTAKGDWMLGVAGPYSKETMPFEVPKRVFSRFNVVGTVSPASEVAWVHENINR